VGGGAVSWGLEALAVIVNNVANALGIVVSYIELVTALFRGDWAAACEAGQDIWNALVDSFMAIADLFRIGDWLRAAWADALEYLGSINLFESGARILETLKEGILSAAGSLRDGVKGVFGSLRDMLPFSDAKTGPLSDLTLSGSRLMTTLAEGVRSGAGALLDSVESTLAAITPEIAPVLAPAFESADTGGEGGGSRRGGDTYHINIDNISLPNVKDAEDFMQSLRDMVDEYGGSELA
jgi:hypothetical protein